MWVQRVCVFVMLKLDFIPSGQERQEKEAFTILNHSHGTATAALTTENIKTSARDEQQGGAVT